MDNKERAARFTLAKTQKITPVKFKKIFEYYHSAIDYCENLGIKLESCVPELGKCWIYGDDEYPKLLTDIPDPPILLYHLGSQKILPVKLAAVVGTRGISGYGDRATREIVEILIDQGYTIVSGLAFGVDSVVHEICAANKVPSVAVLANNVNKAYPATNHELYKKIINNGCVISEFNLGIPYNKFLFARRNRIIAGLAQSVYVTEAPVKSGAIMTANYAFDYDREVFAIPGGIYQGNSLGCNRLIAQNKAQIYFKDLVVNRSEDLSEVENQTLKLIESGICRLDDLQRKVYISGPELITVLTKLELKRIIAKDLFDRYSVLS